MCIDQILLLCMIFLICEAQEPRPVQLKDVNALTLYAGRKTNARRSPPVPQLRCTGGNAKCLARYLPKVVQCVNRGSDGLEVQWDCKAELEAAVRFGTVHVTCEGFSKPSDSSILVGSCGLEYTLELTGKGKRFHHAKVKKELHDYSSNTTFNIVFLLILLVLIYFIYRQCSASRRVSAFNYNECNDDWRGRGFSPHPPPYDGSDQRPPPYNPESMPGFKSEYANDQRANDSRRFAFVNEPSQPQQQSHHQGFSFLTGTAVGGILGYMFGRSTSHVGQSFGVGEHHSGWSNHGFHRSVSESSSCSSEGDSRAAHGFGGTSVR